MRKTKLIPFGMTPAAWGLSGPAREEAEASYYYSGYDLDRKLAEIRNRGDDAAVLLATAKVDHRYGKISEFDLAMVNISLTPEFKKNLVGKEKAILEARFDCGEITEYDCDIEWAKLDFPEEGTDRELALLAIELRHGKITAYEHDCRAVEIENPEEGTELELAKLEVELLHDRIDENLYQKTRATILEEPWIGIIDQGFDPNKGLEGVYFKFDWNDYWITFLRLNGYIGATDDQVVEQWFADVCRTQGDMFTPPDDGSIIPFSGRP